MKIIKKLRIFSDSEEEADDHQVAAAEHARDFNESITQVIILFLFQLNLYLS